MPLYIYCMSNIDDEDDEDDSDGVVLQQYENKSDNIVIICWDCNELDDIFDSNGEKYVKLRLLLLLLNGLDNVLERVWIVFWIIKIWLFIIGQNIAFINTKINGLYINNDSCKLSCLEPTCLIKRLVNTVVVADVGESVLVEVFDSE